MKVLFPVLLFFTIMGLAGELERVEPPSIKLQFLSIPAYHSTGFHSLTTTPIASIADANPAALVNIAHPGIGALFAYTSSINYDSVSVENITLSRYHPAVPTAAGIIFPYHHARIALGYHQKYNYRLESGEIPLITGYSDTVGYTRIVEHQVIHSVSGILAYEFPGIFTSRDVFSLGGTFSFDILKINAETVNLARGWLNDQGYSFTAGVLYQLPRFSVGFLYQHRTKVEGELQFQGIQHTGASSSYSYYVQLPPAYALGATWSPAGKWQFHGTVSYVLWEKIPYSLSNGLDYSVAVNWMFSPAIRFSGGFYRRHLENRTTNHDFSYTYFVGGVHLNFNRFQLLLEIQDNHTSAEELFQVTWFNVGFDVVLR